MKYIREHNRLCTVNQIYRTHGVRSLSPCSINYQRLIDINRGIIMLICEVPIVELKLLFIYNSYVMLMRVNIVHN